MAEWIIAEPGRLVLSGTRFSVRFDVTDDQLPFIICDDGRAAGRAATLLRARTECERRQAELVAVGLE